MKQKRNVERNELNQINFSNLHETVEIETSDENFVEKNIFNLCISICLMVPDIGLAVRVFANGPGDLGSIPGRVIPKTQKMVLDASLLNTQHYKVRIKGKVEPSREGVAPSPTSWCSSYRKGSLCVTLDYGRQLYFFYFICLMHPRQQIDQKFPRYRLEL